MAIRVSCPCGGRFQSASENAGRRARCPSCGRELVVPRDTSPTAEAEPPPTPSPVELDRPYSGKALASFGLGLLSFGCALLTGVPAVVLGLMGLSDIQRSRGLLRGWGWAVGGMVLGGLGCTLVPVALLIPAVQSIREAAHSAECVNNLKQIGLAMHQFQAAHNGFPPAAITDRSGKPLLSWRVALLTQLGPEGQELFEKFRLNEPWDSPHNLALLPRMPDLFACPSASARSGYTHYRIVVGQGFLFTGKRKGVTVSQVTDGTSNTIMAVESSSSIPWTAPEDYGQGSGLTPATLGNSPHPKGFYVLLVDGSVRFFDAKVAPSVLVPLLTTSGGELVYVP